MRRSPSMGSWRTPAFEVTVPLTGSSIFADSALDGSWVILIVFSIISSSLRVSFRSLFRLSTHALFLPLPQSFSAAAGSDAPPEKHGEQGRTILMMKTED